MAWRVIAVTNPAHLSSRADQLIVKQDEEVSIPIEDIDTLLIDSYGVSLSAQLLSTLSQSDTTVVFCDEKHLPASTLLPYSPHSRQAKISANQLAMSVPFKKQLRRRIIEQKIINQAEVLKRFGLEFEDVLNISRGVKSGDTTNRESLAARIYFSRLLDDATRRKPIWHNAALNYGYALVRSSIARHISTRGLVASQGIFHRSELNGFNLADDLIEPFRAAVDFYVLDKVAPFHIGDSDARLSKYDRERIIDLLNSPIMIKGKKFTIKHAIEINIESFAQTVMTGDAEQMLFPTLIKI